MRQGILVAAAVLATVVFTGCQPRYSMPFKGGAPMHCRLVYEYHDGKRVPVSCTPT